MTRDELIDAVTRMRKAQNAYLNAALGKASSRAHLLMRTIEAEVDTLLAALPPTEAAPVAPVGLSDAQIDAVSSQFALDNGKGPMFIIGRDNARIFARALLAASPATAPQASEKPSKPFGWVVACERKGSVFRLSRIVPSEAHAQPIVKQWTEEHTPGIFDIVAMPLFKTPASHAETAPQATEPSEQVIQDFAAWATSRLEAVIARHWVTKFRAALAATQATGASADALDAQRYRTLRAARAQEGGDDPKFPRMTEAELDAAVDAAGAFMDGWEDFDAALQGAKP